MALRLAPPQRPFSVHLYCQRAYAVRQLTRRHFLRGSMALASFSVLAGCSGSLPIGANRTRPHRIGYLNAGTLDSTAPNLDALRQGLRDLGHEEGRDITLDVRFAEGREERLPDLATELVHLGTELIVTGGREAISAARQATSTIPIVFATAGDPVAEGLVASLAQPGGNATGLTLRAGNEWAKRLQLLKEVTPSLSHVAVLWNPRTTLDFAETEAPRERWGWQSSHSR
jgi:putative ABC transport system substrate-binding protein